MLDEQMPDISIALSEAISKCIIFLVETKAELFFNKKYAISKLCANRYILYGQTQDLFPQTQIHSNRHCQTDCN